MLVSIGIKKIMKEKPASILPDIKLYQLNELELLQKQIEREMDSLDLPVFYSTGLNVAADFTVQLPSAVFTVPQEKEHTYSFEYSTRSPARVIAITTSRPVIHAKKKKAVEAETIETIEEETQQWEIRSASPAPTTRFRATYTIKI
jgi:hypothetical protein